MPAISRIYRHASLSAGKSGFLPPGFALFGEVAYIFPTMPNKPIELPPRVVQAFVRDREHFSKQRINSNRTRSHRASSRALALSETAGEEAAARGRERDVPADEGSRLIPGARKPHRLTPR
jgi:hypothetical protein